MSNTLSSYIAHDFTTTGTTKILGAEMGALLYQMILTGDTETGLGGTNYIFVQGKGTPAENKAEVEAAKIESKKLPRYLGVLTDSEIIGNWYKGQTYYDGAQGYIINTTALNVNLGALDTDGITETQAKSLPHPKVIIAPSDCRDGSVLNIDTEGIDIVSLTGNLDVLFDGVNVTANDVFIKGIDTGENAFVVGNDLSLSVIENCKGGNNSFNPSSNLDGLIINCVGKDNSFGATHDVSAKIIRCTGGISSFAGDGGNLIGTLQSCTLTVGDFSDITGTGHIVYCINGDGTAAANQ